MKKQLVGKGKIQANETVPFTEMGVKEYLDKCIRHWRCKKQLADATDAEVMATHYVDAFQSVRISIFGELLPAERSVND